MNADTRRFSVLTSRLMCLCVFASAWFICSGAFAADPPPVINSISPDTVIEKPIPQPQIVITGSNLRQPGVFDGSGNPTVTITHTTLPGVSFSVVAGTNFTGTQATIASNLNHFNMLQMPLGVYDLTLMRPDGQFATVPAGFSLITEPDPLPGVIEMRIASRWGGPVQGADISEDGTIAYIANGRMFRILDLSDETNPVEISSLFLGNGAVSDVKVKNGYAFIAMGGNNGGFRVVDVSDLAAPDLVWAMNYPSAGDNVELWGDYAYVGARAVEGASVRVFDISDPLNVVSHGTMSGTGTAKSITIHGDYLYVGRDSVTAYLSVFALSANPVNPPQIGAIDVQPGDIALSTGKRDIRSMAAAGNYLYMWSLVGVMDEAALLLTVDITNPAEPVITSTIGPQWLDGSMAVGGGLLFVGSGQDGVHIFDLAYGPANPSHIDLTYGPANPSHIASYMEYTHIPFANRMGGALAATDGRAYLWDAMEGFVLVDVSNPALPQRIGKYHSPARLGPMARQGDLLYISDFIGGFTVLDVADPNAPYVIGDYAHQPYDHGITGPSGFLVDSKKVVRGIAIEGERAYITLNSSGLEVIDISDPASPTFLNAFRIPEAAATCFCNLNCSNFRGIAVQDGLAHVGFLCSNCSTCSRSSILTLDVSDANNLSQFSLVEWPGSSGGAVGRIALSQDGDTAFGAADPFHGGMEHYVGGLTSTSPVHLAAVPPSYTSDIAWHNDILYVTRDANFNEDPRGLWIRDVADPENPLLLSVITEGTSTFLRAVAVDVQNDRAYVRWEGSPFQLYDVSDPADPVLLHGLSLGITNHVATNAVLVEEPIVYVTNGGSNVGFGLQIVEVVNLPPPPPPCHAADFDCNGVVNVFDLLELLAAWGPCQTPDQCDGNCFDSAAAGCWCDDTCIDLGDCCAGACAYCPLTWCGNCFPNCPSLACPADLDNNGVVNVFDLLVLLANWGPTN